METIFALSGEVPPAAADAGDAALDALQTGSLLHGSARELCFVRKITGGGAVLHIDSELAPGERLDLELMNGQRLRGTVDWRNGSEAGLRFDQPLDVFSIIVRNLVNQPGERRRMPRIELRCPARLESTSATETVFTRDISQGGVKIETRLPLAADEAVRLTLDGFRTVEAVVRWCDGKAAGLAFTSELGWQELTPWLKERRDRALRRPSAPSSPSSPSEPKPDNAEEATCEGGINLNLPARVREGMRRWNIEVATITPHQVEFESFAALRLGTLLWIVLPGLEGWPARVQEINGYRFVCQFTQPLHPAVLERVLAAARARG